MSKLISFAIVLFLSSLNFGQTSFGEVIGNVIDENEQPVFNAHVFIDDDLGSRYQAKTDVDGTFRISSIPAGTYSLNVRQYNDTLTGIYVEVPRDGFYNCGNITLDFEFDIISCPPYLPKLDLRQKENGLPIKQKISELSRGPQTRSLQDLLNTENFTIQIFENDRPIIRGARSNEILYVVDGVKSISEVDLPRVSMKEVTVYHNCIPAKYGDTTGGAVIIETKGYFDLYREWKSKSLANETNQSF